MQKIKFSIITLFPEALGPYLNSSMLFKAQERGIIQIELINLREYGLEPHRSVDDTPYGGGDGMLLRCEPVFAAVEEIKQIDPAAETIIPTPIGITWDQSLARQFAGISNSVPDIDELAKISVIDQTKDNISEFATTSRDVLFHNSRPEVQNSLARHYIILCPHYEGYDERILSIMDHKISLGNYVLTGGELPALIIVDSITRLLPGVLGGDSSALVESFSAGDNLEYPQYTRPENFRGMKVPEVLLSGNHAKIAEWRTLQSKRKKS